MKKKIIFSGLLAIGLTFSMNAFAQESVRSNQIEKKLDRTTNQLNHNLVNATDTLKNGFTRTRSDMRHVGDTLRNEYDRTRSRMDHMQDTVRNQYDRTRDEMRKERKHMEHKADSLNRRFDPVR